MKYDEESISDEERLKYLIKLKGYLQSMYSDDVISYDPEIKEVEDRIYVKENRKRILKKLYNIRKQTI